MSRKLLIAAGVIASVGVVAVLIARHVANSEMPFALFVESVSGKEHSPAQVLMAVMAATQTDCRALAAGVRTRLGTDRSSVAHVKIECMPESDLTDEWRTQKRRLGRYRDHMVYLYGGYGEESVAGAYFLAIPGETHGAAVEIDGVFPDRENCERRLDLNKSTWKDDREFKNSADYKNSTTFKTPEYAKRFDEDERQARGACAPVRDPEKLKREHCEGLPFTLDVVGGSAQYDCDYEALHPQFSQP
jgi:hypothetical protein